MSGAEGVTPTQRRIVALSASLATLLYSIDITIASVALPHMQGSLQATQDQILWVVTSYIVTSAIATPLAGYLAVRYGDRRVLLPSVGMFTITSMLCGISTSLPQLVLFRGLQGIAGSALLPIAQSAVLSVYPREQSARAVSLWAIGVMVGPVIGPTLGGWITEYANWRWVFYINVPVGLISWLGLASSLKHRVLFPDRKFDLRGYLMLAAALALLQLMLDRGNSVDWFDSPEILVEGLLGGALLYMFVVHSLTAKSPFFQPALFRDRNLLAGVGSLVLLYPVLLVPSVLLPVFMQQLQGNDAATTGLMMAPRGVGMLLPMVMMARTKRRIDPRPTIGGGLLTIVASCWPMAHLALDTSAASIAAMSLLQGLGMGLVFGGTSNGAYLTLPSELRTEATVVVTLGRMIGGAVFLSAFGAMMTRSVGVNRSRLVEFFTPFDAGFAASAAAVPGSQSQAILSAELSRQAAVIGYDNCFAVLGMLGLLAAPTILLFKVPKLPAPKDSPGTSGGMPADLPHG